ncbi:hypothetical protein P280DRAFT_508044 [Massarina eburnea CBS 473.64]|uniref:Spindle pole body component n=1 Tax=Massarina eburnea CBS 473.64 TaxID=1395130 RepID=A0A6A6RVM0_9PLEO|nr:hypothetical protein P280DRAFT_508044 [Massarina eburnea CBS 473.64]
MDEDLHDSFATNRLWQPSSFLEDPATFAPSLFAPLQLDVSSIKIENPYAPKGPLQNELRLPDIDAFEFGPLPDLDSFDESSISLDTPPTELEEEEEEEQENIWQAAFELGPAKKDVAFFTWDTFENAGHQERQTPYIAESGPQLYDAALVRDEEKTPAGSVLKDNALLESLWNLGLGRSSILFSFNPKLSSFEPTIADGRTSGLSLRVAQSVITQFVHTGNTSLYLRSFVERTFASAASIPARVALATSVSSILSTFEDHLGRHSGKIRSLLQLQRLFEKPREILDYIARTVDGVKHANSNEQLSSIIHNRVLEIEEGDEHVRHLSCEILRHVSQPSLHLIGEWIGIRQEQQTVSFPERGGFVGVDESADSGPLEYIYRPELMPRYISPEDGNTIFETGNSLRFLKLHHPEHPMASMSKFAVDPPSLQWEFGWNNIESISQKAKAYEEQLRAAILGLSGDRSSVSQGSSEEKPASEDFQDYLDASSKTFDAPPQQILGGLPDELQLLTSQILSHSTTSDPANTNTFSPPLSITSTLSFRPLLTAQAKLVNATTLRLFFRSHQLSLHLSLQRQYQLLGDGVFSSRLASALFDPDRESAIRHKGKMRSGVHMGLQLGARESWPPASSELRLALMGVLSESYYSSTLFHSQSQGSKPKQRRNHRRENDELPGQLNFAVRQLTETEMERIMDPYALYAIDFLRMHYVPPSPLNLVFTASALDKYDLIFKFLLRLLRILFVVSHLPRSYSDQESRAFRMEAHHFVTALSTYIFQTGIAEHWNNFDTYVKKLETRLEAEDADNQLGTRVSEGIGSLRDAHEKCLDTILFSLLLRRRQKKVMALMEEIFELILLFAKKQSGAKVEQSVQDMYAGLKGKIRVFLSVCRQLEGKRGYGKGRGTAEENSVERLGVLVEMNGYFGAAG